MESPCRIKRRRGPPPDCVQHAGGDALSPGRPEDPDATDAAQSRFWNGGAAPGPVALQDVVPQSLGCSRLLHHPVGLWGGARWVMRGLETKTGLIDTPTWRMGSATTQPTTILSVLMNR